MQAERQIASMDARMNTPGAAGSSGDEVLGGSQICIGNCHTSEPISQGRPPNSDEEAILDGMMGTIMSLAPGVGENGE